jgi:hypothetical protein
MRYPPVSEYNRSVPTGRYSPPHFHLTVRGLLNLVLLQRRTGRAAGEDAPPSPVTTPVPGHNSMGVREGHGLCAPIGEDAPPSPVTTPVPGHNSMWVREGHGLCAAIVPIAPGSPQQNQSCCADHYT